MIPTAPHDSTERAGLVYPHGAHVPDDGRLLQVADGVFWLRMPIPFSLDHINLWVLDGGDHWAIVDTGFPVPQAKAYWRALFEGPLAGKPVGRVIVTHYHPDHIGLAGWLTSRWQVPLEISRGEFLLARVLTLDNSPCPPDDVVAFYARLGWPEPEVEALRTSEWGRFGKGVHRLPTGYHRLRAGDRLFIGGRQWDVVVGSGHSPEHVCLHDVAGGLLISGDQVLPRITSNVSVYPTEPDADPLGEWLDSIARLKTLPDTTLVLPAHNEPFLGLHARLDQLAADHHRKLEALIEACAEPLSAHGSFATLFRRPIQRDELQMASGEALAHLTWLHRRGQIAPETCDGVTRYRRVG
jgi:glyoxylase-like metal-dependent hydrolase (beta-lactamase superfamily II)